MNTTKPRDDAATIPEHGVFGHSGRNTGSLGFQRLLAGTAAAAARVAMDRCSPLRAELTESTVEQQFADAAAALK